MSIYLIFYLIITALLLALLEIQIEGKYGWAGKLPTWRIKNPFSGVIKWPYLDGYHLYLWSLLIFLFHLPYFFGLDFNLRNEIIIIQAFLIFVFAEDFFWFVFNPAWGIKKYFSEEIPWHGKKFLGITQNVWVSLIIILTFSLLIHFFSG